MNRNERRSQQKQSTELATWYRTLPPSKKNFIQYAIEKQIIENDRIINIILDKCYMAATANNIDIDIIDLEKIISETSTYIQDYKDKLDKGDVMEMIKATEKPIKEKMKSFIKAKKDKVASIKELEKEYNIPFAELDVMWLQVKSKMGIVNKHAPKPKNIAEEEVKEVMKETKEIPNIAIGELKATLSNEGEHGFEIPYTVTQKEIEEATEFFENIDVEDNTPQIAVPISKLKIIEQTIKIQGEYGIYLKTTEGVKIGITTYKDIKDIEGEKQAMQDELEVQNQELQKELIAISKKIKEIAELRIKENEKYEEIEAVFKM